MDYGTIGLLLGEVGIIIALVRIAYWLGGRLSGIERDIEALKRDVEALKASVSELRERLGKVEDKLSLLIKTLKWQGETMTHLIEHLKKKGIIEDVDAWKTVFNGITSIIGNPFTSEEKKRLLELINKDNLTPEEADEFERLAWRFWSEHMDKREAWYLLLYAAAKRGETYGKHNKKLTPLDLA